MLTFRKRLTVRLLLALVFCFAGTGAALAYWTASGSGTASGSTGSVNAPAAVSANASSSTVAVSWTAPAESASTLEGFHVFRTAQPSGTPEPACGGDLVTATSCEDVDVANGEYRYTVRAEYGGWTATSAPSSLVGVSAAAATSTTALVSSPNPSKVGQPVTYTATVTGSAAGAPSGNVAFRDGEDLIPGCTAEPLSASAPHRATCTQSYSTVGSHEVSAEYLGDSTYPGSTSDTITHSVDKGDQSIAFTSTAPSSGKVGTTYVVSANGGASGNAVTFSIDPSTSSNCSIAGATVTFNAIGECRVNANQAGNANYAAAAQVQQTTMVSLKGDQSIAFTSTAPINPRAASTYTPAATSSSGLTISFSIAAASSPVCSISNGIVTFNSGGTCTLNADQAGNGNYNAASQVTQSVIVVGNWTFGAIGPAQTWTTSGSKSISYPAGTANGDLLLLAIVQTNNAAAPTAASIGAAWTQAGTVNRGNAARLTAYWAAAGAETSINGITAPAGSTAYVARYTRSGTLAPVSAGTASTASSNSSTAVAGPSISATGTNATVISLAGIPAANTLSLANQQNFGLRAIPTTSNPNTALGIADRTVAATGVVTAPTWQSPTAVEWTLVTAAFR